MPGRGGVMDPIIEAWKGARDTARTLHRQRQDVEDGAQDAALAILQLLANGRKQLRNPRAYGSRIARDQKHSQHGLRVGSRRIESFADGFGWGIVR